MKSVLENDNNPAGESFLRFWCEGCNTHHRVPVSGPRAWQWNGSVEAPTLHPSIRVETGIGKLCHSFVVDGSIKYLTDCTHSLAGQLVVLKDTE